MGRKYLTTLTLLTQPSAPSSPSIGDMYYDTTLGKIGVYTSSGWVYYLYQIEDGSVTTSKIADGAVTSSKLAPGAAVANIGYTPVNKAGDTMSGSLTLPSLLGPNNANLLINGQNYGVEVRIDEDSSGSDTFSITSGSGGSTTLMLVQNNGNVGIGTTSPAQKLDVAGNISGVQFISTATTGTAPLVINSTTVVNNLNADMVDGLQATQFLRSDIDTTYNGTTLTIKGDLIVEGGYNAIAVKDGPSDNTPGYLEKVDGTLRLSFASTNPVMVYRGTATGQADIEIFKDSGSGVLPIYLRFHQGYRHWEAIKATNGLISFVNGNDTDFIDIQARRVTANQDLVVAGKTIANSSGIPYSPLPALGNRNRDILVDRVAVWGDGMYPFALELSKSDGWFTIPRYIFYGTYGQFLIGSDLPRSNTTRVTRLYIESVDNLRYIYNPTDQYWNNGRTTGKPWVRLSKLNGGIWQSVITGPEAWSMPPNLRVYILEIPTSVLDSYFQVSLGIWWDENSPSWPTSNIPGDTIANNYQNYGADTIWTIYRVWFEVYDRY
jgi:hypothetical protein